jgi:hypothetical protein
MIIKTSDGNGEPYTLFDFDKIITAPSFLKQTEESTTSEYAARLIILRGENRVRPETMGMSDAQIQRIRAEVDMPDAPMGQVAAVFLKIHPEEEAAGRLRLQAILETGYSSWYSWNTANWGTKWNSYSFHPLSEDPLEFCFKTAWSFPWPIFEALAREFPTLQFKCRTTEEMGQFYGEGCFNPGPGERPYELNGPDLRHPSFNGGDENPPVAGN